MKLNDIYQPDDNILNEGLLRVIGKVLKYAAVVVGTVLLIGITKRVFFPEEEKEKIQDDIKYAYKVILGMQVELESPSYLEKVKNNFHELTTIIGDETNANNIDPEVYIKKHSRTEYTMNTVLWYLERQDVNRINKEIEKINKRYDVYIDVLQTKKQRI